MTKLCGFKTGNVGAGENFAFLLYKERLNAFWQNCF